MFCVLFLEPYLSITSSIYHFRNKPNIKFVCAIVSTNTSDDGLQMPLLRMTFFALQTRRSSSGKCRRETSGRKATTWKRTADCSRTPAPSILSASPSCAPWSWWLRLPQGASLPTHTPTTSTPFRLIRTGKRTCPPMICGKQALDFGSWIMYPIEIKSNLVMSHMGSLVFRVDPIEIKNWIKLDLFTFLRSRFISLKISFKEKF